MTARYPVAIPYTPHQTPEPHAAITISGFELDTIDEEDQDLVSTSTMARHTPASSQASSIGNPEHEYVSITELQRYLDAMAIRVEQLVEENELQAEVEKTRKGEKGEEVEEAEKEQGKTSKVPDRCHEGAVESCDDGNDTDARGLTRKICADGCGGFHPERESERILKMIETRLMFSLRMSKRLLEV